MWYKVTSVSQADTITITDPRLKQSLETGTCSDLSRFSLPDSPWLNMTTLYKCNNSRENGFTFANCKGGGSSLYYFDLKDSSGCSVFKTPESWSISRHKNQSHLNATFSLHINLPRGCRGCHRRGGECTMIKGKFRCHGASKEDYQGEKLKLGLGILAGLTVIITIVIVIIVRGKIARKSDWNAESVEAVVMLKRYSYSKVKKMTNSFAHVLGKGGFGTVYNGKLPDGGVDVADFGRGEVMKFFGDQITKEEERIARKMVLVGLWCIQTNPSDRPPMIKVIEMLEGNLEDLQVPPKPLFCLPTVTVPEASEDSCHEISSFSKQRKFGRHAYSLSF
ncbi:hypothetical protein Bca101_066897 [Brassica carinata]